VWGRDEQPFGDFAVGEALGDETDHGELRSRDRLPTGQFGFLNDAPPNPEFSESSADPACVPCGPDLHVRRQSPTEADDRGVAVRLQRG